MTQKITDLPGRGGNRLKSEGRRNCSHRSSESENPRLPLELLTTSYSVPVSPLVNAPGWAPEPGCGWPVISGALTPVGGTFADERVRGLHSSWPDRKLPFLTSILQRRLLGHRLSLVLNCNEHEWRAWFLVCAPGRFVESLLATRHGEWPGSCWISKAEDQAFSQ